MLGNFGKKLSSLFIGKNIDDDVLDNLEELLITSDISYDIVSILIDKIRKQYFDKKVSYDEIKLILRNEIINILKPCEGELDISFSPFSLVMVGVNGSGKTTTIGKLANYFISEGKSVSVVACDTFRLSAIEQLKEWTDKVGANLIFRNNAEPSGLAYDGYNQAKSKNFDIIMIDTAGRLANNDSLMAELIKIIKTLKKIDENAPSKTILVLDGNGGQNSLVQMEKFGAGIHIDGFIITKTEGSAKFGFIISLAYKYKLPIYFVTNGEGVNDILKFDSEKFVDNLFKN